MAEIVLGIGSSHGPLLSTPPEQWDLRAKADRENKNHWFRGKTYDYESLLKSRAPGFAHEITVEKRRERFIKCRAALESLGKKFNEVAPDAVIILGNDQREFFNAGLTPAITIYRGSHDQQRAAPQRGRARASISRNRRIHRQRVQAIPARPRLPITSCDRLATRTSILRSRTRRRVGRPAEEFRMRTASSTTRSCRTRRRRACRSF